MMREFFERQLSQKWNIQNPELFELNEKGNYKFSAVDRKWAYYRLYQAVDKIKSEVFKLFSTILDKL